jgi:hypothetical protein
MAKTPVSGVLQATTWRWRALACYQKVMMVHVVPEFCCSAVEAQQAVCVAVSNMLLAGTAVARHTPLIAQPHGKSTVNNSSFHAP